MVTGRLFMKEDEKIQNNTLENTNHQNISIQLSVDGFSFCIYTPYQNEIKKISDFTLQTKENYTPQKHLKEINKIFNQKSILNHTFNKVFVTHVNPLVTQVPKPFFNKKHLKKYLDYTIKTYETDYVTFDEIPNDIVNVYIPFVNINNFFIDKFGGFEFKHSSSIFIDFALKKYKNNDKNLCLVNVFSNYFELIVIKNKKFTLYNQFNFTTKEDFIYYILFVVEQLQLNPQDVSLILFGTITKSSELYQIAYRYIKNISFYENKKFTEIAKNNSLTLNYFTLLKSII